MNILSENNTIIDTDSISTKVHFSVLSFKDYKNPDFYCEKTTFLESFESSSICLEIGGFHCVMPLPWNILVSDYDNIETMPLYEISGRNYNAFSMNPISGYMPKYLPIKTGAIYRNTTWTIPNINEKDMLVVPLGYDKQKEQNQFNRGPVCVIFSPSKLEINRSISDIW